MSTELPICPAKLKLGLFIPLLCSVLNLLQVLRGKCCVKGRPKIASKIINFVYFICLLNTSSRQRNCTILKYCIYKTLMALEKNIKLFSVFNVLFHNKSFIMYSFASFYDSTRKFKRELTLTRKL